MTDPTLICGNYPIHLHLCIMSKQSSYEEPSWSCPPKEKFQLEVLKDGSIVDTINLEGKAFFTLGRQPDIVDIVMEHMSISRMHAVLNFRDDGALMLRDLGSAQGTQLNKSQCVKDTYYRVYVGDLIKFGASTRKYIVVGPESQSKDEYNSANLQQYRVNLAVRSAEIKQKLEKEEEQNGFSWGMREDAPDEPEENEAETEQDLPEYLKKLKGDENYDRKYGDKFTAGIDEKEAKNSKDAEIMEKIRKKERKIQNMQEENRRIYLKEASQESGLTEGQIAAVARNDKAIASLENDVEDLVRQIRAKAGDRNIEGGGDAKRASRSIDDEDDVLDLTAQTADSTTNWRLRKKLQKNALLNAGQIGCTGGTEANRSLSYADISDQVRLCSEEQNRLAEEICNVEVAMKTYTDTMQQNQKTTFSEGGDQLEIVMASDRLAESKATWKRLQNEKSTVDMQLERLNVLLKAATPALSSLISHNNVKKVAADLQTSSSSNSSAPTSSTGLDKSNVTNPKLVPMKTAVGNSVADSSAIAEEDDKSQSQDKLSELVRFIEEEKQAEAAAEAERAKAKAAATAGSSAKAPSSSALKRPLEADRAANSSSATAEVGADTNSIQPPTKRVFGAAATAPPVQNKSMSLVSTELMQFDSNRLEGGETAWVPPKQQKGDGKTTLNDKFGY